MSQTNKSYSLVSTFALKFMIFEEMEKPNREFEAYVFIQLMQVDNTYQS